MKKSVCRPFLVSLSLAMSPACRIEFTVKELTFCFDYVYRRRRRSSILKEISHVLVREGTLKQINDTFHTQAKNHTNSLKNSQPQIPSEHARVSFCPSKTITQQRGTNKMKESPYFRKPQRSNCDTIRRNQTSQLNSKGLIAHVPSSFIFSHHIPLL